MSYKQAVEFYNSRKKWNLTSVNQLAILAGLEGFPHGRLKSADVVTRKVVFNPNIGYHEINKYEVVANGLAFSPEFDTIKECADFILTVCPKNDKDKGPLYTNAFFDKFHEKYNKWYDYFYEHNDEVAGYWGAVDTGDAWMSNVANKSLCEQLGREMRNMFTSDREVAALMFALKELNVL